VPFGRGFATASILILVALACIAIARRFEKERRLIAKLHTQKAFDPSRAIRVNELSDDERMTVSDLTQAGVLRGHGNARYLELTALSSFRIKRIFLACSGALAALAVAALMAFLILKR
jgi:hypothetical protein